MSDQVRVRVNGFGKTVGRGFAEKHGLEVLDEPTRRRDGRPRGMTPAAKRPKKTSATKAAKEAVGALPAETAEEASK